MSGDHEPPQPAATLPPPTSDGSPPSTQNLFRAKVARETTWMMLVGGAGAVVAAFLPWYTLGIFTVNGTAGDGQITIALGAVLAGMGALRYRGNRSKSITWVAIVTGALIAAIGLYHSNKDGASIGVYATAAAGICGFIGGVQARRNPAVTMVHSAPPSISPAPGWHADPWGIAKLRWWNGTAWTGYTSDGEPPQQQ